MMRDLPLVVFGLIISLILLVSGIYNLSNDEVIGYTEHGIPVLESELKRQK